MSIKRKIMKKRKTVVKRTTRKALDLFVVVIVGLGVAVLIQLLFK